MGPGPPRPFDDYTHKKKTSVGVCGPRNKAWLIGFSLPGGSFIISETDMMRCKKHNKRALATLWILAAIVFNGPARSADFSEDIQRIVDRGSVVIAMVKQDSPPFFFESDQGGLKGLDIRLAQGIAERLGVDVEYNRDAESFDNVVDLVASRQADIALSKLSRTLTRARRVRYTEPYIVLRQGLMVNRLELEKVKKQGQTDVEAIKRMRGTIGVIADSSYVRYASTRFPRAQVQTYESWDSVVQAVLAGDVLAAYRDELEIKRIIKARPKAVIKLQTVVLTDTRDPIAMAVHHDDTHLLAWLNLYLDTMDLEFNADSLLEAYPEIFD